MDDFFHLDSLHHDGYDLNFGPEDDALLDSNLLLHDAVTEAAGGSAFHHLATSSEHLEHAIQHAAARAEHVVRTIMPEAGDLQDSVRAALADAAALPNPFV